jgi:hypothetical protein
MADYVPVKAYISRALRRRAFAAFALLDTNYSRWTLEQLERWLQEAASTTELIKTQGREGEHLSEVHGP